MIYGNLCGGVDLLYGQYAEIGINEWVDQHNEFTIYPNPQNESSMVYLKTSSNFNLTLDITIYDLSGRPIQYIQNHSMEDGIDIQQLSSGLYIFELNYKNSLVSKLKFIKQ
jgi:hypothetical protein